MSMTKTSKSEIFLPQARGLIAGAGLLATLALPAMAQTVPWRNADVMGSVNVVTSVLDGTSTYADSGKIVSSLQFLGMKIVRDSLPPADQNFWTLYQPLIAAGIKFNMLVPLSSPGGSTPLAPAAVVSILDAFLAKFPGSIASIEGLNEIDLVPGFSYAGKIGTKAAVAYQHDLYHAVLADSKLAGIPVYNFSFHQGGNMASLPKMYPGDFDFGNQHGSFLNYPETFFTNQAHDGETPCCVGAPYVWSEGSYVSFALGTKGPFQDFAYGENEATQANYLLNTPFNFRGLTDPVVGKMFIFQLADPHPDHANQFNALHNGMFRADWSAKPAATGWHNMAAILADKGPNAATFKPVKITYTVTGLPSGGHTAALERSNGNYFIAIWPEVSLWNNSSQPGSQITIPPSSVTINAGTIFGTIKVYDPLGGATPIKTKSNAQQIGVTLTDHLLLVELDK